MTMGRPPKAASEVLGTDIRVRVSGPERAEIEVAAQHAGLQVSAWLRMVALKAARSGG